MSSLTYQQLDQFLRQKAEKLNQKNGYSVIYSSSFANAAEKTQTVPDNYLEDLLHMGILTEEELDELLSLEDCKTECFDKETLKSCECKQKTLQDCLDEKENCQLDKGNKSIEDFTHTVFDVLNTLFGSQSHQDQDQHHTSCCDKSQSKNCNHNEKCEKDKMIQNVEDIVNILFSPLLGKTTTQDKEQKSTLYCDRTKSEECNYDCNTTCKKDGEALFDELKDVFKDVRKEFKNEANNLKSVFKDLGLGDFVQELQTIFEENSNAMDEDKNFTCTGKQNCSKQETCEKQTGEKVFGEKKVLDESVFNIIKGFLIDSLTNHGGDWKFTLQNKDGCFIIEAKSDQYPLEILHKENKDGNYYLITNTERNEEIQLDLNESRCFSEDLNFLFEKRKRNLIAKNSFLSFLNK